MSEKRLKRQQLKKQLFTKNRLVILNEETFEEIFSLKLNLMNVFVVLTISSILLISITTYIIAFTPLREFIPGYASNKLKKDATILAVKEDFIPPTINHFTDDDLIDSKLNLTFNEGQKRVVNAALTNTFGFGGHNASIVIKKFK